MGDKVRIAVIGGGRAATPLIEDLIARPFVEMAGVADKNMESPGAIMARANGVFFTEDAGVLAAKGADIDVIFELSGDRSVKPALKEAFQAQGNRTTIIVQDLVARMILSLIEDSDELRPSVHPDDRGIG